MKSVASIPRRGGKIRRSTVESAQKRDGSKKGKRNAKKQLDDELAKMGEWPAGLPQGETRAAEIPLRHMLQAKSHPMWGLIARVASCDIFAGSADRSKMRRCVKTRRWELWKKILGWVNKGAD